MGEKFGRDSIWESHLTNELYKTEVSMQAVLGEITTTLGEVLRWKVGTQVLLNTSVEDELELRCGNVPMFRGPVGQKQGSIAVRIEKYLPPDQEGNQ